MTLSWWCEPWLQVRIPTRTMCVARHHQTRATKAVSSLVSIELRNGPVYVRSRSGSQSEIRLGAVIGKLRRLLKMDSVLVTCPRCVGQGEGSVQQGENRAGRAMV